MSQEEKMRDLGYRCSRIRELDKQAILLNEERDRLYYEGLTVEEHNLLFDLVCADGKRHIV